MSAEVPFSNFQNEIYFAGLNDVLPQWPTNLLELEDMARRELHPGAFGYVAGSAGTSATYRANLESMHAWRIVARVLRNVENRDLSSTVLGTHLKAPLLLGPVGVQTIVHPEGELATARAAASVGIPFVLSTASSYAMEEVAEAAGQGPRWYQLYWPREQDVAASLVARAEAAGFTAIVVTLDTFMLGWRPTDHATAYLPFLRGTGIANYLSDPAFRAGLPEGADAQAAILHWALMFGNPALTWSDLKWLRARTSLPIVLKGVMSADDAKLAVDAGVDAIICSNHGGRQLDGSVGAIAALPGIVEAVNGAMPVLFDSGIRGGADMFKAIALGAAAVLLARPYVYGLGLGGEAGVRHVIRTLLGEFDVTMAMAGTTSLAQVNRTCLTPGPRCPCNT